MSAGYGARGYGNISAESSEVIEICIRVYGSDDDLGNLLLSLDCFAGDMWIWIIHRALGDC